MKKRLTKLLLLLAVLIVGSGTSWAKDDVTATYLTDAALADETANWALTSTGGNHAWNGSYKIHESWHNTFSISQTVSVPNGYYQISIQAVSQQNSKNALLRAASGSNSATAYIKNWPNGSFADISNWMGINPMMCRIYATVKVENGSLTVSMSQTNDNEWIVYGQMKLFKLSETEYNNAIALQSVIEAKNDIWNDGWENQGGMYRLARERYNTSAYTEGKVIYKTIEGLPSGEYDVTLHAKTNVAWITAATGNNIAEIYANDAKVAIPVEGMTGYDPTDAYNYTIQGAYVTTDGKLEVGIRNLATGGNWYIVNLLDITYKGTLETSLALAKADANTAAASTKPMNSAVKTALNMAIANYGTKAYSEYTNVTDLRAAISALNTATSYANTSIAKYEEAKAILDAASSMDASGQAAYAATDAVKAVQTAYTNGTLDAVNVEQKTACEAALVLAAKAQTTAGSDMTLAISNWDFRNCANNNFPGWTIEAPNGGNTWANGDTRVEYWIGSAANGKFDYSQTVTGLPAGKYSLTASMWNSSNGVSDATPNGNAGVYGTSGSNTVFKGVTVDSDNANLGTYTTDNLIVANGTLRLGVKNNGTMSARWFGIDWIKLTYVGGDVTADDVAALVATIPEGAMNATVQSNLTAAKNALDASATWANYGALSDAIEAAKSSVAAYANAAQYLPVNKAELAGTNFVDAAVYQAKITDAETALAAGTMTDEEANGITDIRTGWRNANYIDDVLMSAWDENVEQWESLHINTWSGEGDSDGSEFKAPFFEYWTGDGNSLGAKTMTATVEGLEAGDYAVTAWVRVRAKNGASAKPYGISMKANDGDATEISGTQHGTSQFYLEKYAAIGTVGADGKLTLTFDVAADNNVSWLSFKDVNYMKGAATLAAFKQTNEPVMLRLAGTEAFLTKDGVSYIQDATTGLAVKGYDIATTDVNQLLSGQLYGTVKGDTLVVEENAFNSVTVSEGTAVDRDATAAEAAAKANTFRLVKLNMAEISETDGVYYANIDNDKVEIDNRLTGDGLVLNAGDIVNTLTGVTFLTADGSRCVLAPRSQDDVVPLLWKSEADGGDDISGDNAVALTGDDVMARMTNLKAGDVLYVEVVLGETAANLIVNTAAGENLFTIPATGTTVEIPVTGDMEEEVQKHGLVIEGSNSDLKAKFVTAINGKYSATADLDNTIWLGQGNAVTLGKFHFKDVRKGDLLTSDGTMTAEGDIAIASATALTGTQAAALLDKTLAVDGKSVVFEVGDDPRDDIFVAEAGDTFDQEESVLPTAVNAVNGIIMTYGGNDPDGTKYSYAEVYPEVNKFATVTEGIGQAPLDAADKSYDKEAKNLPVKGTYYVFEPTKDGQLEVTVGVEKGKTIIVTEDGEAIVDEKKTADFEGSVTFPVEATKTYYVFAPETNLKLFGYKFTPADANAGNTAKDIATFKLLKEAEAGKTDKLLLNDAVVTYIKGDNVFVEDASGAIDFFETQMQFYVGQKLNGYIYGKNSKLDNMPVLLRTGATPDSKFTVEKGTAQSKVAPIAEVKNEEGLARFVALKNLELTKDKYGLRILIDEAGDTISLEDRFNVLYELSDLFETIEGIVGINEEGKIAIWPTSKEGIVVSDGYKKVQETELDVTNKDVAKTKNNPVVGISITLDGACNAGSGSAQAGAMTSKGYKLRTANGSPVANSATFTVNEGKKVYGMVINGVGNYKAKDESLPFIKVTKVEVDGNEVNFEGGEFPAKGASDCGTLTLKNINATKSIVLYFDNSNAEGTQINIAYAVTYNGEKIYTQKELALIDEAKELAKNRDAIAVGCLDDAIEAAEAGNTEGLQKAIDQFKADNATSSVDFTNKVGKAVENWVNVQEGEDFKVYTGNGVNLVQVFGVTGAGNVLTQQISGLENGTYNIGMYATSHNAWDGKYGANKAGKPTLQEDANDVAYVFGTSGSSSVNTWITARRNSGLVAGEPELYQVNGVKVADGKLTIGLSLAQAAKTEWHSVQIASLRMVTTAKEAYAAEKANLQAAIDDAEALLAGDQIGGKAKLQDAVDAANEALVSIRLNVPGMANEVAKLRKAIDKFHAAGKVFVQNVATGKYLGAGASWGTHAVLNDTGLDYALTTNSDGTKNFDSQVSNGGAKNFLNGEWNDGDAFGWTVSQLSNGNYTISNGSQYLSAGNDNLVVLSDNADEWRFITVDERKEALAAATSSAPVDATFLIKGANFNRNDKRNDNWTVSDDCTNRNLSGGNNENNCAESYHSTFTISQVVEDAPAGTYTLTIQGFCRQDGGAAEDAPVFFANEETKAFGPLTGTENSMTDASVSFTSGLYTMEPITVVVAEDGTLTVGVKGTGTSQWVIWDNFQLKYYGNGGSPDAISETVAEPVRFEDGAIYNLRGQKMTGTLKPGLYIKNGKKIVIK